MGNPLSKKTSASVSMDTIVRELQLASISINRTANQFQCQANEKRRQLNHMVAKLGRDAPAVRSQAQSVAMYEKSSVDAFHLYNQTEQMILKMSMGSVVIKMTEQIQNVILPQLSHATSRANMAEMKRALFDLEHTMGLDSIGDLMTDLDACMTPAVDESNNMEIDSILNQAQEHHAMEISINMPAAPHSKNQMQVQSHSHENTFLDISPVEKI